MDQPLPPQAASSITTPSPISPTTSVSTSMLGAPLEAEPNGTNPTPLLSQPSAEPTSRVHVDARGLALGLIAAFCTLYGLQWAQKFFIPLVFGIFLAYTLNPVVCWIEKLRLSRFVATSIVMLVLVGGLALVGVSLNKQFASIVEQLPNTSHRLSQAIGKIRAAQPSKPSAIENMQGAADEIAKATTQAASPTTTPATGAKAPNAKAKAASAQPAATAPNPATRLNEFLWAGSLSALGFLSQAVMVLFLVFFVLLSGDTFKRKLVKLTSGSLSNKKITVQVLDATNDSIQKYMFMLLVTNVLLALMMWVALGLLGLENAGAWAVAAGLLHIIPYFGPLLIMGATGIVALLQFESLSTALLVAGSSLAVATVVGTFVTTWMTGRIAKMNATAVFVALLFWGWLWGVWGLLLGVPIVVVIKVAAGHIEGLETVAELLGE